MDSIIFLVLEIIAICSFSLSGAIIGIRAGLDAFGVLVSALFTSFGGGLIRDILLGNLPPLVFRDYTDLIFAVISSAFAFIFAYRKKRHFEEDSPVIDRINNIVDAMGLGLFTIIGMNTAISCGYGDNAPYVVFLGLLTGVGGGMLRDVTIGTVPLILRKRVYALASIAGGIVYYLMTVTFALNTILCIIVSVSVIFLIRILASVFHWDIPKAF